MRVPYVTIVLCGAVLAASGAAARTLEVGPQHELKRPSAAAAVARDGDIIEIEPGEYVDCAVWTADRLVIAGRGAGAVVTRKTCEGKGLFVIRGNDVTVRNLTFVGARVPDGNGAGIRAQGRNLTVENSRFIDNEDGILTSHNRASTLRIIGSTFLRNGVCAKACAHGVYAGAIRLLQIERSQFSDTRIGHHIKSRALTTRLIDNRITDGASGSSSYLVDVPNGGAVLMEGNVLEKGPQTSNAGAAVVIGAEGVKNPTPELIFRRNSFTNRLESATEFVRNYTDTEALVLENRFFGDVIPLSGKGTVR